MHWTETPQQVKGFGKRRDVTRWEVEYFPDDKKIKWIIQTKGKPKIWEWIEENVDYGKITST